MRAALALYQIDSEGLDRLDIAVLNAIVRNFNGGPVGLNNLAAMVGEESETVETVCEPYLVREGFLIRTPKGRVATAKACLIWVWSHKVKQTERMSASSSNIGCLLTDVHRAFVPYCKEKSCRKVHHPISS